jgi:hypothetical protein
MSIGKKCLKCGHTANFDATPGLACPTCGAVYSKVEAMLARGGAPAQPVATKPVRASAPTEAQGPFIERLRGDSHYPSFRAAVRVIFWIFVVLALGMLVGGAAAAYAAKTAGPLLGGLFGAILLTILAKVGKEASLMLADLSDAAVRMAQRQETEA